jgi:hypothetical protein
MAGKKADQKAAQQLRKAKEEIRGKLRGPDDPVLAAAQRKSSRHH